MYKEELQILYCTMAASCERAVRFIVPAPQNAAHAARATMVMPYFSASAMVWA
jgi:hypothetical protein